MTISSPCTGPGVGCDDDFIVIASGRESVVMTISSQRMGPGVGYQHPVRHLVLPPGSSAYAPSPPPMMRPGSNSSSGGNNSMMMNNSHHHSYPPGPHSYNPGGGPGPQPNPSNNNNNNAMMMMGTPGVMGPTGGPHHINSPSGISVNNNNNNNSGGGGIPGNTYHHNGGASGPVTVNNQHQVPGGNPKQCAGCGVRIQDRFLLLAMDRYWHTGCLKCSCCQAQLGEIGTSCFTKAGMILCRNDYIRAQSSGVLKARDHHSKLMVALELEITIVKKGYMAQSSGVLKARDHHSQGDRNFDGRILCVSISAFIRAQFSGVLKARDHHSKLVVALELEITIVKKGYMAQSSGVLKARDHHSKVVVT
ncbi:LIM domain transcription factor lmo4-like [Plakobranchus ocellatus]|uniref:LIM domain transcription factor lmo4-like n=1 Tax=Plakobranchus ocellatus TaxID=259542 RepID=A0AAV4A3A2_9GAST|nr:LIM domain transcription factor lmo4-like [Plakobranchus ocellatus]